MTSQLKRINIAKLQGVYYRLSAKKRHHGKPDRCYDICYRDQRGKLIWEKVGWASEGYTEKSATLVRADRIRAIRHGEILPKDKAKEALLSEVWTEYDKWLETGKARPRDDRNLYNKHLKNRFANKRLSEITPLELESLKSDLTKQELAPASIKHVLVLVRQIINKAITWGLWAGENPVKKIKLPKLNNRRERFLTQKEAKTLLEEVKKISPQVHDIALISLHTGMRAGEIFALKWQHIDIEHGLIHIADPKSGRSRKAFMTPTLKAVFQRRSAGEPDNVIFKARKGEMITEVSDTFIRAVDKLQLNEGVDDARHRVTFHTLRHTFASWLAMQGTHILTIKELLGHQSLTMTERYSHLVPDQKRNAVKGIEKMMRK